MRSILPVLLTGLVLTLPPIPAVAQTPALEVRTARDSEAERATADEVRVLPDRYDLRDWVRTPGVLIDERAIPHSHPVLTLHTRHLGDEPHLLSTFVHEQLHWWVLERSDALAAAETDLRSLFPETPTAQEGGARDEESTYLHLVVCHLEFQAMTLLFGEARGREIVQWYSHYEWIYDQVTDDPRVAEVMARHGLVLR